MTNPQAGKAKLGGSGAFDTSEKAPLKDSVEILKRMKRYSFIQADRASDSRRRGSILMVRTATQRAVSMFGKSAQSAVNLFRADPHVKRDTHLIDLTHRLIDAVWMGLTKVQDYVGSPQNMKMVCSFLKSDSESLDVKIAILKLLAVLVRNHKVNQTRMVELRVLDTLIYGLDHKSENY
eukprot:123116_1